MAYLDEKSKTRDHTGVELYIQKNCVEHNTNWFPIQNTNFLSMLL